MTVDLAAIRTALERTLDDLRVSRGERSALEELLRDPPASASDLAHLRRTAFDLVRERTSDAHARELLEWLEIVNRLLVPKQERGELAEAFFTPGCLDRIRELLRGAETCIDICVFTITDDRITSEIIDAKRRGLVLRIISDDDKANDPGSDVDRLASRGVQVRFDRTEHHMHHKFAVFDRRILTTGSYNWTRSAEAFNQENLVVTDDVRLVRPYLSTFEELWDRLDPERR
jgi:phosphatidylserine/phosphatidylglycerophosphate/cardiolipin synthase-like enzyme